MEPAGVHGSLFLGFMRLGFSLMLLKWIIVGSVQEYMPTNLVGSKGMGQDAFFLPKPSSFPKAKETSITTAAASAASVPLAAPLAGTGIGGSGGAAFLVVPYRITTHLTTITRAPTRFLGHHMPIWASPCSTTARGPAAPRSPGHLHGLLLFRRQLPG